jgi:hypothetical protein
MIHITEAGHTDGGVWKDASVLYFDHQPGDATRYEILAVDLKGKGIHIGALGYVSNNAIVVVCGMGGEGTAALFKRGQQVAEFYVAERLGLKNPHTIHHITELVAKAISGEVVACEHAEVPA